MVFSSNIFILFFLPIFLIVYYVIGNRVQGLKNWWVLLASLFFYAWGEPRFIFVIVSVLIIDFFLVQWMDKSKLKSQKNLLLSLSLILKLTLLLYFKYVDFFIENINVLFSFIGMTPFPFFNVLLPLGISFFTFQSISYTVDVYRGTCTPLKSLRDYLLYILLFPQLIAGPIVRFNDIADQIRDRTRFETDENRLLGLYRFVIGLSKKVLVANVLGAEADQVFNGDMTELGFAAAWYGIVCYSMQIYFDFAGYSDMAIGIAKMIGFQIPENFNNPYISRSITEFWRRWHITLGSFMKDYIYIPLGGNRNKKKYRTYFNLWIVFFLSGLWHGAGWTFIIWGCFHGAFLVLDRWFLKRKLEQWPQWFSISLIFILVLLSWVFFRAENIGQAVQYFEGLFGFKGYGVGLFISKSTWFVLLTALAFSFSSAFNIGRKLHDFIFLRESYNQSTHLVFLLLSVLFIYANICAIVSSEFNPFIYFRF